MWRDGKMDHEGNPDFDLGKRVEIRESSVASEETGQNHLEVILPTFEKEPQELWVMETPFSILDKKEQEILSLDSLAQQPQVAQSDFQRAAAVKDLTVTVEKTTYDVAKVYSPEPMYGHARRDKHHSTPGVTYARLQGNKPVTRRGDIRRVLPAPDRAHNGKDAARYDYSGIFEEELRLLTATSVLLSGNGVDVQSVVDYARILDLTPWEVRAAVRLADHIPLRFQDPTSRMYAALEVVAYHTAKPK